MKSFVYISVYGNKMKKFLSLIMVCSLLLISATQMSYAYSGDVSLPFYRNGSFTSSSSLTSDGTYKDTYCFYGTAGQTISVSMDSSNFDAYLIILDSYAKRVATDDDSGSGTNAYLEYTLPSTGEYSIVASQFRKSTGSYSISASYTGSGNGGGSGGSDDSGDDWADAGVITISNKYTNIYSSLDHENDEDYYMFRAPVDGRYYIETVRDGTDVDTFGELRTNSYSLIDNDDDSGSGSNFEISADLDGGSWYYIKVCGSYGDEIGNYNLRIKSPVYDLIVPQRTGNNQVLKVGTVFENGFDPAYHGFFSENTIYYQTPNRYPGGACFGMCAVAALKWAGMLPSTGPTLADSGFGYDIKNISEFEASNLGIISRNSTYNIGTLANPFDPSAVTTKSSVAERIGQAVGWFQYNQDTIRNCDTNRQMLTINYTKDPEIDRLETIDDITRLLDSGRPFEIAIYGDVSHSVVPTSLYKVIGQEKFLLGVYDPDYSSNTNYIEIMTEDYDNIIDYNVIRHESYGNESMNRLIFTDLSKFDINIVN